MSDCGRDWGGRVELCGQCATVLIRWVCERGRRLCGPSAAGVDPHKTLLDTWTITLQGGRKKFLESEVKSRPCESPFITTVH